MLASTKSVTFHNKATLKWALSGLNAQYIGIKMPDVLLSNERGAKDFQLIST
jgi:hypothetical protein